MTISDRTAGVRPGQGQWEPTVNSSGGKLGSADFLRILTTQLKYQDPMKPMDDREFIAQMAQLSSLDQLSEQTRWARLTYGLGLMGQRVAYVGDDGTLQSGLVTAVRIEGQRTLLSVDSQELPIEQVLAAIKL